MECIRKYLLGSQARADRDYGRVVSLEGIALHTAGCEDWERSAGASWRCGCRWELDGPA